MGDLEKFAKTIHSAATVFAVGDRVKGAGRYRSVTGTIAKIYSDCDGEPRYIVKDNSGVPYAFAPEDLVSEGDMSDDGSHRKVYGRGYYDGLRAASEGKTDTNSQRLRHIENNLPMIAKKVLDAVPIQQAWSITQIKSELSRVGLTYSSKAVSGCLNSLTDSGLVKEPKTGVFTRVSKEKAKPVLKAVAPNSEPAESAPAERVSAATKLMQLGAEMRALADRLDDAVLELEAERESQQAELASIQQLKTLLKTLT